MPRPAIAVMRNRLTPAAFTRTAVLAQSFTPLEAIAAGVFDRVVTEDELLPIATEVATGLAALDMNAHAITKRLARTPTLDAIAEGIDIEYPSSSRAPIGADWVDVGGVRSARLSKWSIAGGRAGVETEL